MGLIFLMMRSEFTYFYWISSRERNLLSGGRFDKFNEALGKAKFIVGQNLGFDLNIMGSEFHRLGLESQMSQMPVLDTCTEVTVVKITRRSWRTI
jgi:hypothetical protein